MIASFKQAIPQEFCLKCRGCCRFSQQDSVWQPRLLEEEKSKVPLIRIVPAPGENYFICGNLSSVDNKCKIYINRPFDCRIYPFLFDRKNNKVFLALDLNCAFVRESNKNPEFELYTRSLIELVQSKEYLDILKNNPLLAQEYEGAIDLIELKI